MKRTFFSLLAALTLHTAVVAQNTPASPSPPPTMGRENLNTGSDRSMNNGTMRNDGSTTAMERGDATTMIGNMSRTEFDRRNTEGNAKVAAITPTSTPLSKADQKLMMEMAMGGMMQLQVSQAAVGRVQRDDVKVLAQSEVEEQTGVSAKLQEIARAKGMTLPAAPAPETQEVMTKMQGMSGMELDRYYTKTSGVKGHMKLQKTGAKIMAKAQDPALKALASATAPVIQMHMQVSQQALDKMGKSTDAAATR